MHAKILLPACLLLFSVAAQADPPPMPTPPPPDPVLASGDFDAAEHTYAATLARTPADPSALAGLARIRVYQNRLGDARKLATQALAADANNVVAKGVLTRAAAREAAFAPDVWRMTMPADGVTLPFVATDPLPVVEAHIGDRDVFFLIDTGAPDLVIDKDFAGELGLAATAGPQGIFAGGQHAATARGSLPDIAFGALHLANVPVAIMPTRNFGGPRRIDGIVGTGFLMHFLATLDYARGALKLKPRAQSADFERDAAKDGATIVPLWLVGDHFLFARGHVNHGPEGLFNIDTGLAGGGLQATRATLQAASIVVDEKNAQTGQGGGGAVRFVPFHASASIGALTVPNLDGVYTPDGDQFGIFPFAVAGTISHQFFRAHAVTFDFDAMRMVIR